MKQKILFLMMMALALTMVSCGGDDDDGGKGGGTGNSKVAGTWQINGEDGITTVTLTGNGQYTSQSVPYENRTSMTPPIPDGKGQYAVEGTNVWDGLYIRLMQSGKEIRKITIVSYKNDYMSAEIRISGYGDTPFFVEKVK